MEKARTRDLAVLSQCLLQSVPTLYTTCVDYDTCTSEAAILVAVASNTRVRPILCFAKRSSDVLGQRRTCVIVRRNVSSQLNHAIFKQLPAAAASATTAFLQKKVQQPASTMRDGGAENRRSGRRRGNRLLVLRSAQCMPPLTCLLRVAGAISCPLPSWCAVL